MKKLIADIASATAMVASAALLAGAALLVAPSGANASLITDGWSWSSPNGTGSGTLTYDTATACCSPTEYQVTGMTGIINAFGAGPEVITFFPNPSYPAEILSPSGFFIFDDAFLPGQNPLVTNGGLLFLASGLEWNIFSNGPSAYVLYNNAGQNESGNFSATPLPAAVVLFGSVLAGAGLLLRRRRSRGAIAA
jgi:hypothetical protein